MAAVGGTLLLAGCGSGRAGPPLPRIDLSSPAFTAGGSIPSRYTCDGADLSLPLRWSGVPRNAVTLTLTMRDPDAPGGNFIHWDLRDIPASITRFAAGEVPPGVIQGVNGFGTKGYRGPCPPRGGPAHHYVITLIALRPHRALALGTLTGTYARR
jgi:Raf kinase inhibitor-like YbhB/YbcL family protein